MDLSFQALVMGLVQGLTEFVPVSSSGHLIGVPWLFGWHDAFLDSLEFSVMLHMGTLVALLVYFWRDWLRLIPAWFASLGDRSLAGDPDRRLAWLIVVTTIPAAILGVLLNDFFTNNVREVAVVAAMLVVGGAILWLADRWGLKLRPMSSISFRGAFGIGCAQAIALVPGISRSGISISAGLLLGLNREAAARFSFLMSAPIIAGAGLWEARKLVSPDATAPHASLNLVVIGFLAALVAGLAAVHFMLEFLRRRPMTAFIVYRFAAAAFVFAVLLSRHGA